jgi:hypothetical protein
MMQLSMKSWNSAFNAQSSRLIVIVVQLGAVKICVAAVEALRTKTQFTTKIDAFWVSCPVECWCTFLQAFLESHPVYDQTQGSGAVFFLLDR